jgi:histone H3/H4
MVQGSAHKAHVGRENAKRHSGTKKSNEQSAISRPAIRRLARKGGVKRIADDVYDSAR